MSMILLELREWWWWWRMEKSEAGELVKVWMPLELFSSKRCYERDQLVISVWGFCKMSCRVVPAVVHRLSCPWLRNYFPGEKNVFVCFQATPTSVFGEILIFLRTGVWSALIAALERSMSIDLEYEDRDMPELALRSFRFAIRCTDVSLDVHCDVIAVTFSRSAAMIVFWKEGDELTAVKCLTLGMICLACFRDSMEYEQFQIDLFHRPLYDLNRVESGRFLEGLTCDKSVSALIWCFEPTVPSSPQSMSVGRTGCISFAKRQPKLLRRLSQAREWSRVTDSGLPIRCHDHFRLDGLLVHISCTTLVPPAPSPTRCSG